MRCAYPMCRGIVRDNLCDVHGDICSQCGVPCSPKKMCHRCTSRANGKKCAGCGSPWIYLPYYVDGLWRCKPCVSAIIRDNDFEDTAEQVERDLRTTHEKYLSEEAQHKEKQEAIAVQVKKATIRRRSIPKQDEELFTLETKKKRK